MVSTAMVSTPMVVACFLFFLEYYSRHIHPFGYLFPPGFPWRVLFNSQSCWHKIGPVVHTRFQTHTSNFRISYMMIPFPCSIVLESEDRFPTLESEVRFATRHHPCLLVMEQPFFIYLNTSIYRIGVKGLLMAECFITSTLSMLSTNLACYLSILPPS